MFRHAYLGSLAALQVAITLHAAPPLVAPLSRLAGYAAVHGGAAGVLVLAMVAVAAAGAAVALSFPVLALARHLRRGPRRFAGVPATAAGFAVGGAALLASAAAVLAVTGSLPPEWRALAVHGGRAAGAAGFALGAAGVLVGELLRRNKAPAWLCAHAVRVVPPGVPSPARREDAGALIASRHIASSHIAS